MIHVYTTVVWPSIMPEWFTTLSVPSFFPIMSEGFTTNSIPRFMPW